MTLDDAITALMRRGDVLVGLDFDGTLAPIVDHPDQARPLDGMMDVVRRLSGMSGVTVALVSGRARDDLMERSGHIDDVVYVGEHGNDLGDRVGSRQPGIAEATEFIAGLAARYSAVSEEKGRSVTFHTRTLDDDDAEAAATHIRTWAKAHPEVTLLEGKAVFELTVATRTKGDAIEELRRDMAGVIYIGDDATDETVFSRLRADDVGVKVGDGSTAARYRVPDVPDVLEVLRRTALASR